MQHLDDPKTEHDFVKSHLVLMDGDDVQDIAPTLFPQAEAQKRLE